MSIEYPPVSICTPTFERNRFIPLMMSNLMRLDYDKRLLEWVIDDDGIEEKLDIEPLKKHLHPIKITYKYYPNRRSIGEKRNNLVKMSTHKYIAMMDTDDLYFSTWIKYSIEEMKKNKFSCVCSNQMLFIYPELDWLITGIKCQYKRQGHESGMLFTKKHHRASGGFAKNSQGEGVGMIDFMRDKNVGLLDISKMLCCICHDHNTINKDRFIDCGNVDGSICDTDKSLILKCLYS